MENNYDFSVIFSSLKELNDKNENDIIFETYNSVSDISKKINTMNSFIHSDDYDTLNSYTKS